MKRQTALLAGIAFLALGAAPAYADCAADLAQFTSSQQATGSVQSGSSGEISKDGSLAPLESADQAMTGGAPGQSGTSQDSMNTQQATTGTGSSSTTGGSSGSTGMSGDTAQAGSGSGEISKDGGTMPLAQSDNGGDPTRAMSGQDAQSQQSGNQTAASAAEDTTGATASTGGSAGGTLTQPGLDSASSGSSTQMAALERAREAQAAGNEQACMDALEEARNAQ
ncbi:hypothetical protein [Mongoliimonas terrestris]|uniref:hypothetical protein n=1 Tax=Mongoliimonas terrestris TaxID=1709001 RepID=UPI0009498BFD|nr:hypothetical protein [Mongoliimonas terrestris]